MLSQDVCFQMVPFSMTLSDRQPRFQGHNIIQREITRKRYKIELCIQWPTTSVSSMSCLLNGAIFSGLERRLPRISRLRHCLMLNVSESETARDTDIDAVIQCNAKRNLHMPYSSLSYQMTFSDLAKYSMKRSIARSICNS